MATVKKQFTDAERAAYYKKKANANKRGYNYKADGTARKYVYKAREAPVKRYKRKEEGAISAIGKGLGDLIHPVAGFLGGKLGHLVENVTGFGDYKIAQNSILKGGMPPPQIVNSVERGEVIIRHREYLGDITATTAFTVQSFLINPGLAQTFPWLSQIANSYEQYKLRGVLFEFNSTSSDSILSSATSTALGTVIMQTDYDIADLVPSTKREMLNSEWSSSSKPSETFIHPIECKKSLTAQNVLYTRGAQTPSGFDQRLYDFARFNIATEGMQANGGVVGELWITYEISLMKQQFSFIGLTDHFRLGAITNAAPLGTAAKSSVAAGGTIGGVINGLGTTYSFPPQLGSGKFLVNYFVIGNAASVTFSPFTFINCSGLTYWNNDTNSQVSPVGAATTVSMYSFTIKIDKQGASFTAPVGAILPASPTGGDLWVTRIADSITTFPV